MPPQVTSADRRIPLRPELDVQVRHPVLAEVGSYENLGLLEREPLGRASSPIEIHLVQARWSGDALAELRRLYVRESLHFPTHP